MNCIDVINLALSRAHGQGYRLKGTLTSDYEQVIVDTLDESTYELQIQVSGRSGKEKLELNLHQLLYDVKFAKSIFGDLWETHLNLLSSCPDQYEYLQHYLLQSRSAA
jgi:hypothetical protein